MSKKKQYERKPENMPKSKHNLKLLAKSKPNLGVFISNGKAVVTAHDIALNTSIKHNVILKHIDDLDLGQTPKESMFIPSEIISPGGYHIRTYLINEMGIDLIKELFTKETYRDEYVKSLSEANKIVENQKHVISE